MKVERQSTRVDNRIQKVEMSQVGNVARTSLNRYHPDFPTSFRQGRIVL
jgi:hypothetical protein